ncbi:hypothetical protein DL96DRAFT_1607573 [Flagelloscypha sp. PMI_526]|nr:hypothetical protein DL96DRAFT_1607573 [Flagelloscypha sp. PMI_526]
MVKLPLSPTDHPRDIRLDLLGEIISWLSQNDLLVWALVSRAVLDYVQPVLYRSLQVSGRDVYKLMNTSSHHLTLTKHLRFTYQGFTGPPEAVKRFLKAIVGYGQLHHFELLIEWNYAPRPIHDPIYPVLREFITSLPSLRKIEVMNVSAPRSGLQDLSYITFLHRVLSHPALFSMRFESCRAANSLIRGAPKSSPLASFGLRIGNELNTWWKKLPASLDLTQLRHLYLEVEDAPPQIPPEFGAIEHLTLVFTEATDFPSMNLESSLSGLHSEMLESFSVYFPRPWADLTQHSWLPFFGAFSRFTKLSSVTVFFARATDLTSPNTSHGLMGPKEINDFVNSMKTKSLTPSNIRIVQKAQIVDVRLYKPLL